MVELHKGTYAVPLATLMVVSALTKDRAKDGRSIVAEATVQKAKGDAVDADVRSATFVNLSNVTYRRLPRSFVNGVIAAATRTIKEVAGVDVVPRKVVGPTGDYVIDGSIVLYQVGGDHYAVHNDAHGLRYPHRSWTMVLYLLAAKDGGVTKFEDGTEFAGPEGHYVLWRNYDADNRVDATTDHAATAVRTASSTVPFYAYAMGKGAVPIHAAKVIVNLWLDEVVPKSAPDEVAPKRKRASDEVAPKRKR